MSLAFKYKELNNTGEEIGFFSSPGEVTDDEIRFGKNAIPLAAVLFVIRNQNRLVLGVATEHEPIHMPFVVTTGSAAQIKQVIDQMSLLSGFSGQEQNGAGQRTIAKRP
jgi:hypothetical protein